MRSAGVFLAETISQAIPWFVAIASLGFNVYQFLHSRRIKVKVALEMLTEGHVRILCVDVFNAGTELNDVYVLLEFPIGGQLRKHPMRPVGDIPNPFKFGYSCRFRLTNDNPTERAAMLLDPPKEKVAMVVFSGVREVARRTGDTWASKLDAFAKVDPSLPPPPRSLSPAAVSQPENWMGFQRKW